MTTRQTLVIALVIDVDHDEWTRTVDPGIAGTDEGPTTIGDLFIADLREAAGSLGDHLHLAVTGMGCSASGEPRNEAEAWL